MEVINFNKNLTKSKSNLRLNLKMFPTITRDRVNLILRQFQVITIRTNILELQKSIIIKEVKKKIDNLFS